MPVDQSQSFPFHQEELAPIVAAGPPPRLVPAKEMAAILQVSESWIRSETAAGRIPFLQAGKRRLYNADEVQRGLAARATRTRPTKPTREEIDTAKAVLGQAEAPATGRRRKTEPARA